MHLGDKVRSAVALPSVPVGTTGTVEEIGRLFVAVRFADGRMGYYARRQLLRLGLSDHLSSEAGRLTALGFTSETIPVGSHICLVPSTEDEARAIAAEYLLAGLRAGEQVLCWAGRCWTRALQSVLIAKGLDQGWRGMTFLESKDVYLPGSEFTADKQLARLEKALGDLAGGRLRLFARVEGACREVPENEWWDYEMRATHPLREHGATGLCCYQARRRGASLHAEAIHPYVVKEGGILSREIAPT